MQTNLLDKRFDEGDMLSIVAKVPKNQLSKVCVVKGHNRPYIVYSKEIFETLRHNYAISV